MFTKLQIRRFRHNKKLDVDLEPITIFRGPSGSGKSSLMGALRWLAFNSPSGKGFIHWGCVSSAVKLLERKTYYIRKRSKTENYYRVGKQKYKAFGAGVPEKVSQGLNVSSVNFQRQHASPFWFSETAGEVSRQLNKIVNLDLIDTTLSNLDKEAKRENNRITDIEDRIKKAKQKREELRFTADLNKRLKKAEKMAEEHAKKAQHIITLQQLVYEARWHEKVMNQPIPNIRSLLKLQKKCRLVKTRYDTLYDYIDQIKDYQEDIKNNRVKIKKDERELKKILGKECPLCKSSLK
jgi:DNA repair exonuclease SbcCD ATPase subunit